MFPKADCNCEQPNKFRACLPFGRIMGEKGMHNLGQIRCVMFHIVDFPGLQLLQTFQRFAKCSHCSRGILGPARQRLIQRVDLVIGKMGPYVVVAGCWLLVAGCWLLVIDYWIFVIGFWYSKLSSITVCFHPTRKQGLPTLVAFLFTRSRHRMITLFPPLSLGELQFWTELENKGTF